MKIIYSETAQELGVKAAKETARLLNEAIAAKGSARVILSTGASQFTTLEALVKEDIDWFVGMFDYRSAGRDWKNSRDAVSRGMQKLQGLHPTDPPYKQDP